MNDVSVRLRKTQDGNSVVDFLLNPEDLEHLRTLRDLPQWKVYRKVLMAAKDGYFQACLPMTETNQVMKTMGMVTGLNFAINQLPVLVDTHDAQLKKQQAQEESKAEKS